MTTTLTPSTKRDGRKENASATQAALQLAALQWFSAQGFEKAPVGSICADAGVTVGALYHHFGDKKGLFAAVVEQLDAQLVAAALDAGVREADGGGGPWEVFLAAVDVILAAGLNVPLRRLMLTQAPAVLGAEVWGEIRQRQGLGAMQRQIQALQGHGIFVKHHAKRLAPLILGTLYGAIESLPDQAEAAPQALEEVKRSVHAMLDALREQA